MKENNYETFFDILDAYHDENERDTEIGIFAFSRAKEEKYDICFSKLRLNEFAKTCINPSDVVLQGKSSFLDDEYYRNSKVVPGTIKVVEGVSCSEMNYILYAFNKKFDTSVSNPHIDYNKRYSVSFIGNPRYFMPIGMHFDKSNYTEKCLPVHFDQVKLCQYKTKEEVMYNYIVSPKTYAEVLFLSNNISQAYRISPKNFSKFLDNSEIVEKKRFVRSIVFKED